MIDRVIDISAEPAQLSIKLDRLVVERKEREPVAVPVEEVAVLVLAHRQIVLTHAVLGRIAERGGIIIACNEKMMPAGMMLPLAQHHLQSERFAVQAAASLPTKKRIWQQLVQAKIAAQGKLLEELHGKAFGLLEFAKRVRSGDPDNLEGRAARKYWENLFKGVTFRRDREAEDQNRLLNYAYTVLRAMTARAVCASGLHPSLGVHHHNRYDAFCLADDVMEPFRPMADRAVVHIVGEQGPEAELDREVKAALIEAVTGRVEVDGESRTMFDVLARTAASLAQVLAGERKSLILPEM